MMLCCMQRTKSAERKEYERLQEALARKQAEVRKLHAECAQLHSPTERFDRLDGVAACSGYPLPIDTPSEPSR
eukprot:CAMPEP_0183358922 /NCGR_PEP_ID=MMETSP0164_2-20130417/50750_1 /TAXON_ID=221442 /ORGANISM="Coccolithus pelagicus ssp braarudi, Strain PLY182g" /LENGTH=72 /DNA_ID=CAMNT_0025532927 /DNA_START=51 /DNA_END=269 /DNA_ORIENTATION=+